MRISQFEFNWKVLLQVQCHRQSFWHILVDKSYCWNEQEAIIVMTLKGTVVCWWYRRVHHIAKRVITSDYGKKWFLETEHDAANKECIYECKVQIKSFFFNVELSSVIIQQMCNDICAERERNNISFMNTMCLLEFSIYLWNRT